MRKLSSAYHEITFEDPEQDFADLGGVGMATFRDPFVHDGKCAREQKFKQIFFCGFVC